MKAIVGLVVTLGVTGAAAVGCSTRPRELGQPGKDETSQGVGQVVTSAVCVIAPTQVGQGCRGLVRFEVVKGGALRIVADVAGLSPNKAHGFHIHEFGDLTSPDAMSAGAHYALGGQPHGGPTSSTKHEGDLGNLVADARGEAHLELVVPGLSLSERAPVLGRAVIVHQGPDDLRSQPAGNAGARIGAGVIGIARP